MYDKSMLIRVSIMVTNLVSMSEPLYMIHMQHAACIVLLLENRKNAINSL